MFPSGVADDAIPPLAPMVDSREPLILPLVLR
jgi:hypothetical protein